VSDDVRLGPITCVTVRTPSLQASEAAYGASLDYRVVGREAVSPAQAGLWGVPALAGTPMLLMAPAAASDFIFRFVEVPAETGYRAFTWHGWNAAELIVADVDAMARRVAHSPFEIVAPPMDLSFCPDIRAMQIRGPGGEILYLTQFKRAVPGLPAPEARCAVDRTFIVIVGGASLAEMQSWFTTTFGVPASPVMESRVQTMALEFGLSREHRFRIAALPLRGRCYIEADEMPAGARTLGEGAPGLPPGIAIVTFAGRIPPGAASCGLPPGGTAPYQGGRQAACLRGAAGERLEVIDYGAV